MNIINKFKKKRTIKIRFESERPKSRFIRVIGEEELPEEEVLRKGGVKETVVPKRITFVQYAAISYENLVELLIRQKYSVSDELALLRQKDSKKVEYDDYFAYVESCKSQAKEFISEREGGNTNE